MKKEVENLIIANDEMEQLLEEYNSLMEKCIKLIEGK